MLRIVVCSYTTDEMHHGFAIDSLISIFVNSSNILLPVNDILSILLKGFTGKFIQLHSKSYI